MSLSPERRAYNRTWYLAHRDAILAERRKQYPLIRDKQLARLRKYYLANRSAMRAQDVAYNLELKLLAFSILGGKCKFCGFNNPRALQVDHIAGGGHQHHGKQTRKIYRDIRDGKNKKDYQLLCANCNWIKRVENYEYAAPKDE